MIKSGMIRSVAALSAERPRIRCSKMIAGPQWDVFICDECVELCAEILEEEFDNADIRSTVPRHEINLLKPKEIKAFLDRVCHRPGGSEEGTLRSGVQSL